MIKTIALMIMFVSMAQAQPSKNVECPTTQVHIETNKAIKWSNELAVQKLMVVRNEATGKYYPKEVVKQTSGNLSLKDFPSNKRGYKIILLDASEKAVSLVNTKTKDCVKLGDCSMDIKDIELTTKTCNFLVSSVFYP